MDNIAFNAFHLIIHSCQQRLIEEQGFVYTGLVEMKGSLKFTNGISHF